MSPSKLRSHATRVANPSQAVKSPQSSLASVSQTPSADMNQFRSLFRKKFGKHLVAYTRLLTKEGCNLSETELRLFFSFYMDNHTPYREIAVDDETKLLDVVAHGTTQDAMADLCLNLWDPHGDCAPTLGEREEISKRLHPIMEVLLKLSKADVSNWIEPQKIIQHQGISLPCRSTITSRWNTLDLLMPHSPADHATRYKAVYEWLDNSCAVDAPLGLAIELDAWRVREDQYARHRSNNPAVEWLRTIARTPWGTLTDEARGVLRDDLHSIIAGLSEEFPEVGRRRPVTEVYKDLFEQLPQVSSITVRTYWCCDPKSRGWNRFQERNCHPVSFKHNSKPIGSLLQSAFATSEMPYGRDDMCCTKKAPSKCKTKTAQDVIVGRLSPIIVLTTSKKAMDGDLSDPGHIRLKYSRMDHDGQKPDLNNPIEAEATYELVAVIYLKGSHYVMESQIRGTRIHFDMMGVLGNRCYVGPSKCPKGSWALSNSTLELMVFRVVDESGCTEFTNRADLQTAGRKREVRQPDSS